MIGGPRPENRRPVDSRFLGGAFCSHLREQVLTAPGGGPRRRIGGNGRRSSSLEKKGAAGTGEPRAALADAGSTANSPKTSSFPVSKFDRPAELLHPSCCD